MPPPQTYPFTACQPSSTHHVTKGQVARRMQKGKGPAPTSNPVGRQTTKRDGQPSAAASFQQNASSGHARGRTSDERGRVLDMTNRVSSSTVGSSSESSRHSQDGLKGRMSELEKTMDKLNSGIDRLLEARETQVRHYHNMLAPSHFSKNYVV